MVSSHHAELRLEDGAWQLVDLGSSNGTLLNNTQNRARLVEATSFRLGPAFCLPRPSNGARADASADELALVEKMREHTDRIRPKSARSLSASATCSTRS